MMKKCSSAVVEGLLNRDFVVAPQINTKPSGNQCKAPTVLTKDRRRAHRGQRMKTK